jgi:hypothetical protein
MSAGEFGHRVADAGRRRRWARRQVRPGEVVPLPVGMATERSFSATVPPSVRDQVPAAAAQSVIAAAERVLDGSWTVLGVVRQDSATPEWFTDPVTGRDAPAERLAFRINHRDEAETGNIKQVWEMSRHHQVTVLATAWWLSGRECYADAVADQLRSWWRANPFLSGVHWTSGIEIGVRLLSWVWVRRLMDDWPKVTDLFENDDNALRQIAWHQEFLAAFPSRGSSANNHVIAEAAGLLAAACAFPWYADTPAWRQESAALLERELAANTFESGLNREQATDYHRFVLELALSAAAEADVAGHPLSEQTWQCLARMADAGAAVLDVAGHPPRQGDGDEGRALVVDDPRADPWAVALGSAGAVLGAPTWWPDFNGSVQPVLLAQLCHSRHPQRYEVRPDRFVDAGLTLLRSRPVDGPEIWCRCDSGPHGFLSIAAHAHADALSLEVRHDGVELLVDPGTYCYHGEPEWRQWFRSTLAHNTVQLAGVDQSRSGGPFMWTSHARSSTLQCEQGDLPVQTWTGQHEGYRNLETPAVHRRHVSLDSPGRTLTVTDIIATGDRPRLAMAWHLGPQVRVELDGARARLSWTCDGRQREGLLLLPDRLEWSARCGERNPVFGWYSPRFGQRVPATSLVGRGSAQPGTELVTLLQLPGSINALA